MEFEEYWEQELHKYFETYDKDFVKRAVNIGYRAGMERAAEIAEKSSDFCDLYCSSGEYMAMVDVRDKIIKAIRKEMEETNK